MKLYYLRGALGAADLLAEHKKAIQQLLTGDYQSSNLEKLRGHEIYSFRLNDSARLLFTMQEFNNQRCLLLLEHLPTHDYEKSRFLKSGVLKRYIEKHFSEPAAALPPQLAFEPVPVNLNLDTIAGSEQLEVADYYQQHWLSLDLQQQQALKVALPAVCSGVAGSGKSCVALSLLNTQASLAQEKPAKPILYVTQSPKLSDNMRKSFQELPLPEDATAVLFKTIKELITEFCEVSLNDLVDKEDFSNWYDSYLKQEKTRARTKKEKPIPAINVETAYLECRIASGYTAEQYGALSNEQSSLAKDQRAWLHAAYTAYLQSLKGRGKVNPCFYLWQKLALFSLVVVDEAQDLSPMQLKMLSLLAEEGQIIYFMDSHQRLYDHKSIRPFLLQREGLGIKNHLELSLSYRSPLNVVAVANQVIALKLRLTGGLSDHYEPSRVEQVKESKGLGTVAVLEESELAAHAWLQEQSKQPHCVIVTAEAHLQEARSHFPESVLVMTPEQVKGLEFDVVIAYKLKDKPFFRTLRNELERLGDKPQPSHRPKDKEGSNASLAPAFHELYTCYTRTKQVLVLCEPEDNSEDNPFLQHIRPLVSTTALTDACLAQQTTGNWQERILELVLAGHQQAASLIYKNKLQDKSEVNWETYLATIKNTLSSNNNNTSSSPPIPAPSIKPSANQRPKTMSTNKKKKKSARNQAATNVNETNKGLNSTQNLIDSLMNDFTAPNLDVAFSVLNKISPKAVPLLIEQCLQHKFSKQFFAFLVNDAQLLQKITSDLRGLKDSRNKEKLRNLKKLTSAMLQDLDNDQNITPAYLVATKGLLPTLKILQELGADLAKANKNGATPAHIAAQRGHTDVLAFLLKSNPELVNVQAKNGITPVYCAAAGSKLQALKLLHTLGADLTKADKNGYTPAHIAAQSGHTEVLAFLLKIKPELANVQSNDGFTPAFCAAQEGKLRALELLHSFRVDLGKAGNDGATTAHMAAQNGHRDALEFLLKNNPELANVQSNDGFTPAYCAAQDGKLPILELLHTLGADLTKANNNGETPAHIAAQSGHTDVLAFLLKSKPELGNVQANDGTTPAYCAAAADKLPILELLHSLGMDLTKTNNEGFTPAHIAAQLGHTDVLAFLLKNKPESANVRSNNGFTLAYYAAMTHKLHVLELLHTFGADLTKANKDGRTPAHIAAQLGYTDVLVFLLKNNPELANVQTNDGNTPAYYAVITDKLHALELLHTLGADLTKANKDGATPAHAAAQFGYTDVLAFLLKNNPELGNVQDCKGITPAYYVAWTGILPSLKLLHTLGADLTKADKSGFTPAHIAALGRHRDALEFLLKNKPELANAQANDGTTPAYVAAVQGDTESLRVLISYRVNLDLTFQTTKEELIKFGEKYDLMIQESISQYLSKQQNDAPVALSPLDIAEILGHKEIVELIKNRPCSNPSNSMYSLFSSVQKRESVENITQISEVPRMRVELNGG
ncbi:Phosphocholine transferase AnkX [Legionella massiliensis]|uniref:Phosphocholine transferase AnkX n=1 Tax=Legionella massiliensis TaxID=1034943 RepID=A0A078KZ63_9GAMM|nr:ankyrin repeat domain-containing protein [Legionella massiliensis]CDZ78226.1 Phosphocholine transferase AnkX [Legionella massiliensis]CEE13964.1 Phosphocholine transferase AnkX [Legionella massiliensis]